MDSRRYPASFTRRCKLHSQQAINSHKIGLPLLRVSHYISIAPIYICIYISCIYENSSSSFYWNSLFDYFCCLLSLRRWLKGSNHRRSVQHQIVIKQDCWTRKIVARLLLPAHRGNNSFHLVVVGFNRAKWLREKVRRKTEYLFLFSRYLCGILGWRKLSGLETRTLFFFIGWFTAKVGARYFPLVYWQTSCAGREHASLLKRNGLFALDDAPPSSIKSFRAHLFYRHSGTLEPWAIIQKKN